jgi:hypothetical protein
VKKQPDAGYWYLNLEIRIPLHLRQAIELFLDATPPITIQRFEKDHWWNVGPWGSLSEGPKIFPHSMERQQSLDRLPPALAGSWDQDQRPEGVRRASKIFDLCGHLLGKRFDFFESLRCCEGIGLSLLEPKNWLLDCHFSCSLGRGESRLRLMPKTQDWANSEAVRRPPPAAGLPGP